MARIQGLLLFFALLVAVYGAATPNHHYRPKFCRNHHGAIRKVRNSFAYPREFCLWFNSAKRTHSPLTSLPYTQIINACECIQHKAPSKKPTAFTAPEDFSPVCDKSLKRKLAGITYKQPKQFCKFWGNGAGTHFRRVSPFHKQGLTNMDVYNACACYELFPTPAPPAETTTAGDDFPATTTTAADEAGVTAGPTNTIVGEEPVTITTGAAEEQITTTPADEQNTTATITTDAASSTGDASSTTDAPASTTDAASSADVTSAPAVTTDVASSTGEVSSASETATATAS